MRFARAVFDFVPKDRFEAKAQFLKDRCSRR
jgi:hypothetical protein